ncbi:cysteine hydrolase family protein [Nonomuraea sp. NPDC050556]|uniref:cysteine hydrolase family protein n=1 Tax=Nonomuraea sp. NPDC050556 TaxID=3364369 RepID=UPI0037A69F9A
MKTPLDALPHPAVLVIDMQRDFVDPGAPIECAGARDIVPAVQDLLATARGARVPVIYTREVHRADGVDLEMSNDEPAHCLEGTGGDEIIPALAPLSGDYVVVKRRYSGFFATDLDLLLRSLGARTLVLTGAATDVCVRATAQDAHQLDYRVVVPRECVAGTTEARHEAALQNIDYVFGYVAPVSFVSKLLGG